MQKELDNYKKCPFCAESIRSEAIKCRYCCEFMMNLNKYFASNQENDSSTTNSNVVTKKKLKQQEEWIFLCKNKKHVSLFFNPGSISVNK